MNRRIFALLSAAVLLAACNSGGKEAAQQQARVDAVKHFVADPGVRFLFRDAAKRQLVKPTNASENAALLPDGSLLLDNAEYFRLGGPKEKLELVLKNTDIRIGISSKAYATADKKTTINPRELEALLGAGVVMNIVMDGKPRASLAEKKKYKYKKLLLKTAKMQFSSEEGGSLTKDGQYLLVETDAISSWKKGAPGFAEGVNPQQASAAVSGKAKKVK